MPKVTIDDIAKRAGVSKTSVSFAFNNPERLSEATLTHILQVADELGYSPDPLASNLKTRRTGCLGLLVPQPIPIVVRNPHMFEFLGGIGEVCHERGMSLMLVPPLKGNLRRAIVRAAVDGFITMGLDPFRDTMKVLSQRGIPFVMVDGEPSENIPCVNIDDEAGAYAAIHYILSQGHRELAIFGLRAEHSGLQTKSKRSYKSYRGLVQRRLNGYRRALEEFDLSLEHDAVRVIECDALPGMAYRAFENLWQSGQRPTGIVAMADILSIGILQAAQHLNIAIPADLSLVGFDDIMFSSLVSPQLTTVRQPSAEKGRVAAQLLIDLIEERGPDAVHIVLPVDFIERESCLAL